MLQVVERKRRPGTWSRSGTAYQYTTNGLIEILETAFGRSFCLCWYRSASRRHRSMERLLRMEVDEVLPVLLEDLAWNRTCHIAHSARLACCKLLLSRYLAMSARSRVRRAG